MVNQFLGSRIVSHIQQWVQNNSYSAKSVMQMTVKLLFDSFDHYDWVGVYLLKGHTLVLGPYAGEPAQEEIEIGQGVCGTAVAEDQNQIVGDVSTLDNYIACSPKTRSEIVVLIKDKDRILGQLDIDSDTANIFNDQDEELLKQVAQLLSKKIIDEAKQPPAPEN